MNLTIISLFTSSLSLSCTNKVAPMSPFYSVTNPIIIQIEKSIFSRFFSQIIFFSGNSHKIAMQPSFLINLSNNRFSFFLNRVVYLSSFDEEIIGEQRSERYSPPPGRTNITVQKCIFEHIQAGVQGAAIGIEFNTDITIQSTIFDDIKAGHKGGAIYFFSKIGTEYKNALHSNYNCFSNCKANYGSSIHGTAAKIEIYFSGTSNCIGWEDSKESGAQMDIESKYIMSSNLNLTGGKSIYAGAMEYREANDGFFSFQTIIDISSCFTMAMTKTGTGLFVTHSNIVGCKLTTNPSNSRPAIYFQNDGSSTVRNFCVFKCSVRDAYSQKGFRGMFSSVDYFSQEDKGSTTIENLITDLAFDDVNYNNPKIFITGVNSYGETIVKTHDIRQLHLGECAGDEIAPDMIDPTPTETLHPTVTETPKPTVTETPKPTVTETPKPTVTETPKPTVTETPKPTVTETPKPTVTETPKPTVTETPKPTVTETPKPTVTETPKPTVTETPKPTVTETPKPTVTETPKPTVTETPKPTVTETPKPNTTSVPPVTVAATLKATATEIPQQTTTPAQTPQQTQSASQTQTPIPPRTLQPTSLPTSSPSGSSLFSESNYFTDSELFVGNFEHKKNRKIIRLFLLLIIIAAVIIVLVIILLAYCCVRKKLIPVANIGNEEEEEEEENNETNNENSDLSTNVFELSED